MAKRRQTIVASVAGAPWVAGLISVGLVVLVWIVFGQTLGHAFLNYDDDLYVYRNDQVKSGLSLSGIKWAFTHVHANNWHPITTISHMLDCQLYGLDPRGHHFTNVLLHTFAVVLLFLALLRLTGLSGEKSVWPSAFVAAVFAIHPLRVESVAWVAERKDLLSGVFFMLTLLAYARYVDLARQKRLAWGCYAAVTVLFALGLMCKPTLVTLPFVLLLLDYWPLGRWSPAPNESKQRGPAAARLGVEKIPLFVLSMISCAITFRAQEEAFAPMRGLAFQERFANAAISYMKYLGQLVFPWRLTVLNPYQHGGTTAVTVVCALALLWGISGAAYVWRRRFGFFLTGWFWYVGMLVPMIGIVQVGWQTRADRYTYLPQIGLCIAAGWGARELFRHWKVRPQFACAAAILVVAGFAARSYVQAGNWKNSEVLWRHALDITPDNYIALNNLGNLLMENGDVDQAIGLFEKAIEANGVYTEPRYNLGNAFAAQNRIPEAIAAFRGAVEVNPEFYQAHNNLGCMLVNAGRSEEAMKEFEEALRIHSDYPEAHLNLGRLLEQVGRSAEAKKHFSEAAKSGLNELRAPPGH